MFSFSIICFYGYVMLSVGGVIQIAVDIQSNEIVAFMELMLAILSYFYFLCSTLLRYFS